MQMPARDTTDTSVAPPLFASSCLPARQPRRPLGTLSDFVALSLPQRLDAIHGHASALDGTAPDSIADDSAACAAWRDALVTALVAAPDASDVDTADRALACLDLSLLQQACDHIGIAMPAAAVERLHALAGGADRLPTFLYEDCVLHNPLEHDPRLFCAGAAGASERDFLIAHQRIETRLACALACVERIVAASGAPPGMRLVGLREALAPDAAPLDEALSAMEATFRALRAMPLADFLAFRRYYTPSPRTGIPGPSGRFSASIFLFRLSIEGVSLLRRRPDIAADLRQWLALYPQQQRAQLEDWLDAAHRAPSAVQPPARQGLARLALQPWTQSTELAGVVARARAAIDLCTAMHLGLARRYAAGYGIRSEDAQGRPA